MKGESMGTDALLKARSQIDILNSQILELMTQRFDLVMKISAIKNDRGLAVCDPKREREMLQVLSVKWNTTEVSAKVPWSRVEPIFKSIFLAAQKIQEGSAQ
jgi:chorismate mutase